MHKTDSIHNTRLLSLIAALSAANVAFRIILADAPNIKPIAFLVIVSGIVGGPIAGFAVGWLSMTISDLVAFGAGVWTVGTSGGMAIVGLLAALLWHRASVFKHWKLAIGGFLLAMLYDVGTSLVFAVMFSSPLLGSLLALYIPFVSGVGGPYPFGLVHESTTSILLGAFGPSLIARIRKVYQ
jgi:energy-coupling factor transport system substrate-specific component